MGSRAARLFHETMADLVNLLRDRPPPAKLRPRLEALWQARTTDFVALGRRREALDASKRAAVDAELAAGLARLPRETFAAFTAAVDHYRPLDSALANRLAEFNTITQYANFALLRAQRPIEADRLGV